MLLGSQYAPGCYSRDSPGEVQMLDGPSGVISVQKSQYLPHMICQWKISVQTGKVVFTIFFLNMSMFFVHFSIIIS